MLRLLAVLLPLAATGAGAGVVEEVRALVRSGKFEQAREVLAEARARDVPSAELLDARSQLARGELKAGQVELALTHAREVHAQAVAELAHRELDQEPHLPLALGAAIEVEAQAAAARGDRASAVAQLRQEIERWSRTSLATRLRKNLHLLSLEGQVPPRLLLQPHLGPAAPTLASLKSKVVLLFFWAHWCPDCKEAAQAVARQQAALQSRGLVVLAPTQLYGTVAGGREAKPEEELRWIEQVRRSAYAALLDAPAPTAAENFTAWGASTTPTLVVLGRDGKVVLYHPGAMGDEELRAVLEKALGPSR